MEQRFGQDFSRVRIHADQKAGESARSMGSRAYTFGHDIVFDAGQYDPRSSVGRVLLAHELTHVVQQRDGGGHSPSEVAVSEPQDAAEREAEALSVGPASPVRSAGTSATVHRDKATTATKFRPADDEAAELEFSALVKKYQKEGKSQQEGAFLAIDDMYAKRVSESGGTRVPGTATPGKVDAKSATWLSVPSPGVTVNDKTIRPGLFAAAVDDTSYNCHSFTFFEAKVSKIKDLNALADTIPKEAGPEMAGKKFFAADRLISAGIYFELASTILILPRWIIRETEVEALLKGYNQLGPSDRVAVGDIAIYSTTGKDYPHSGRVIAVDKAGRPTRIKSKWGAQSLFEHDPEAVPSFYGKPTYYRLKAKKP